MSGGHFDYKQHNIDDIANEIEQMLERQGKLIPKDDLYLDEEYLKKFPEERYYITYSKEIQEKMREGIKHLKISSIYAQRIDWYLSGDDGEETFLERLDNDTKINVL